MNRRIYWMYSVFLGWTFKSFNYICKFWPIIAESYQNHLFHELDFHTSSKMVFSQIINQILDRYCDKYLICDKIRRNGNHKILEQGCLKRDSLITWSAGGQSDRGISLSDFRATRLVYVVRIPPEETKTLVWAWSYLWRKFKGFWHKVWNLVNIFM